MAIDMFDTRTMLAALEEMKPANTFLKDRFFSDTQEFETKKVDIDIYVGKRRVAPFVHPKIGGKTVERNGYKTETYEPPEVSPDMVTTAEDMLKRSMGENIYAGKSPDERAQDQLGKDLAELDDMITRREEVMAAEALFKGKVTVSGEGYDETVNFWQGDASDPYVALGAGDRWNEDSSNPLAFLRTKRREVIQKSGVNPRDVIMGSDAVEAFINNSSVAKNLDNRRIDMGIIDPSNLDNGVTYWGYHKASGLDIWSYDEWYIDPETDEEVPMVPEKEILIGSPDVRTSMLYGCVVDVDKGSFAMPRVPVSWTQRKNPAGRIVQIKSKPLPAIHQILGFQVAKVLA